MPLRSAASPTSRTVQSTTLEKRSGGTSASQGCTCSRPLRRSQGSAASGSSQSHCGWANSRFIGCRAARASPGAWRDRPARSVVAGRHHPPRRLCTARLLADAVPVRAPKKSASDRSKNARTRAASPANCGCSARNRSRCDGEHRLARGLVESLVHDPESGAHDLPRLRHPARRAPGDAACAPQRQTARSPAGEAPPSAGRPTAAQAPPAPLPASLPAARLPADAGAGTSRSGRSTPKPLRRTGFDRRHRSHRNRYRLELLDQLAAVEPEPQLDLGQVQHPGFRCAGSDLEDPGDLSARRRAPARPSPPRARASRAACRPSAVTRHRVARVRPPPPARPQRCCRRCDSRRQARPSPLLRRRAWRRGKQRARRSRWPPPASTAGTAFHGSRCIGRLRQKR